MDKKKGMKIALKIIFLIVFVAFTAGLYFLFGIFAAGDSIIYGEYGYIGKIMLAVILVASIVSLAFAMFGKITKAKKIIASTVCAVLIVLIKPAMNVAEKICAKPYTEFSVENWDKVVQISPNLRQYMLPDLEEKYEIVGMNVSEVIELLGDGDWTEDIHERNIRYYRVGSSFPGAKFYVIKNNENGKVFEASIKFR